MTALTAPHAALAWAMEREHLPTWYCIGQEDWTNYGSRVEGSLRSVGFVVGPQAAAAQRAVAAGDKRVHNLKVQHNGELLAQQLIHERRLEEDLRQIAVTVDAVPAAGEAGLMGTLDRHQILAVEHFRRAVIRRIKALAAASPETSDAAQRAVAAGDKPTAALAAYHPDPEINAGIQLEAIESERADLAAGYPPRWWVCPTCGATHRRGWFMSEGVHRCLRCGYVGDAGTMHTNWPDPRRTEGVPE